jgi:hypothetical protein
LNNLDLIRVVGGGRGLRNLPDNSITDPCLNLEKRATNKKYVLEVNSWLHSENSCYHSAQKLLSSYLPFKNVKIKIYQMTVLPFVLYDTWSRTVGRPRIEDVHEERDEENIWNYGSGSNRRLEKSS